MNGHLKGEELVAMAYGEGGDREHVAECAECRLELENLRAFVEAVPPLAEGDPGARYEQKVWEAIEPRLPRARVLAFPVWKLMAVAAAIVVAFLFGRSTRPAPEAPEVALSEKARQRILEVAVLDHLERSRVTLTEWMNLDPASGPQVRLERVRAEDLLRENRLYRQSAAISGDAALGAILDELERTLLDIAHTPDNPGEAELKRIQERIDDQGTLFKVKVAGESLRGASPATRL